MGKNIFQGFIQQTTLSCELRGEMKVYSATYECKCRMQCKGKEQAVHEDFVSLMQEH